MRLRAADLPTDVSVCGSEKLKPSLAENASSAAMIRKYVFDRAMKWKGAGHFSRVSRKLAPGRQRQSQSCFCKLDTKAGDGRGVKVQDILAPAITTPKQ